jgi:hypothetical protein
MQGIMESLGDIIVTRVEVFSGIISPGQWWDFSRIM